VGEKSVNTILRDILGAMKARLEAYRAKRADPENLQLRLADIRSAARILELQAQATSAFAEINGWRFSEACHFGPDKLGAARNFWDGGVMRRWRDHGLYFRAPKPDGKRGFENVAIVGQPCDMDYGNREALEMLLDEGFALHTPPASPHAGIWFPGATMFLVLTRPGTDVRWLPEQRTPFPELQGTRSLDLPPSFPQSAR
jgi:hypothetical protein